MRRRRVLLLSVLLILVLVPAADGLAPTSGTPAAQTVTLTVDATEAPRKLFHAREVIPVNPGPLTLYYPKWIPGMHRPTGPIINLSGLTFTVSGKPLPWRRDPVNASLRFPPSWKFGTGLTVKRESEGNVNFRATSLTTLVDSPVLAGEYFRTIALSTAKPAVEMNIAADSPAALQASPQFIDAMRKLVDTERGQLIKDVEAKRERIEMGYSLGLQLDTKGIITDVVPGMPAAEAKLGPGMTVVAVNGKGFSADALRDVVSAAKTSKEPIQLLVNNEGALINYPIDYHGSERYPHLVRDEAKPDLLSQTIAPLTPKR